MSIQAMAWSLQQQKEKRPTERHVLTCLANYADNNGKCAFPSVSTLSRDSGLSERTVQNKIKNLLESGMIKLGNQKVVQAYIDRVDRRPVCYDLCIDRGESEDVTGCTSEQSGVNMKTERGAGDSPNTSSKPFSKPSKKQEIFSKIRSCEFGDIFNWVEDEVLKDWITHKKNPSDRMIKGMARELTICAQAKVNPNDAIEKQLEMGWAGFEAAWIINDRNKNPGSYGQMFEQPSVQNWAEGLEQEFYGVNK